MDPSVCRGREPARFDGNRILSSALMPRSIPVGIAHWAPAAFCSTRPLTYRAQGASPHAHMASYQGRRERIATEKAKKIEEEEVERRMVDLRVQQAAGRSRAGAARSSCRHRSRRSRRSCCSRPAASSHLCRLEATCKGGYLALAIHIYPC